MKTLAIVGNARMRTDYSDLVDSCDCVVRFNNCKNYGANVGKKTDLLFINSLGRVETQTTIVNFLKNRTREELSAAFPFLEYARGFHFPSPPSDLVRQHLVRRIPAGNRFVAKQLADLDYNRDFDTRAAIAASLRLPASRVHYGSSDFYFSVWERLLEFGTTDAVLPSTGIVGIESILNDPRFESHRKYFVAFEWFGWSGHPWELEERLMKRHIEAGRLFHLSSADPMRRHRESLLRRVYVSVARLAARLMLKG